jgi:hypothetical protein
MTMTAQSTAPLGELVAAAFDGAARFSEDPLEVSRLGTLAVLHMLQGTPNCRVLRAIQRPAARS